MAFAKPTEIIKELSLSQGMEVADFGAGAGHYAIAAANLVGESGGVYVIDVQQELLTKAKSAANPTQLKSLHFICGDVEMPGGTHLKDGIIDAVIMSNLLFQLEDKAGALAEAWRILKPNGKLLVSDWSASFGGIGPAEEHVVPKETARELAEHGGFKIDHEFGSGDYHYGMVLLKTQKHGQEQ
jgi:ubiquinone/menaquinone biosynthesis C-methylase UbiE